MLCWFLLLLYCYCLQNRPIVKCSITLELVDVFTVFTSKHISAMVLGFSSCFQLL